MKDMHAPFGRGGGFVSASPRLPCPICGARSWCQISRDRLTALCKRNSQGTARVNTEGVTYYVHHNDGRRSMPAVRPALPAAAVARASAVTCDIAYRAILTALTLSDEDRMALLSRGLDDAAVRLNRYRTLDLQGRARLAKVVLEVVGAEGAGVPGMVRKEQDDRAWWSFGGAPGLVIPVLDLDGRVVALKVRRRDAGEGPRYLWVSSARHGGPSAPSVVHVPRAAMEMRTATGGGRLIVTEGELKADVATALSGCAVVSIPGVGSWAKAVDVAKAWEPSKVAVALDMDAMTKPPVAQAARSLVDALRGEGFEVELWRWDPRFKGLDDMLAARSRGEAV